MQTHDHSSALMPAALPRKRWRRLDHCSPSLYVLLASSPQRTMIDGLLTTNGIAKDECV